MVNYDGTQEGRVIYSLFYYTLLEKAQHPVTIDWQQFWTEISPTLSWDLNPACPDRMQSLYHLCHHHYHFYYYWYYMKTLDPVNSVWLHFFHLPLYIQREKNHLNIALCFVCPGIWIRPAQTDCHRSTTCATTTTTTDTSHLLKMSWLIHVALERSKKLPNVVERARATNQQNFAPLKNRQRLNSIIRFLIALLAVALGTGEKHRHYFDARDAANAASAADAADAANCRRCQCRRTRRRRKTPSLRNYKKKNWPLALTERNEWLWFCLFKFFYHLVVFC